MAFLAGASPLNKPRCFPSIRLNKLLKLTQKLGPDLILPRS
jgi:hypothetical protein